MGSAQLPCSDQHNSKSGPRCLRSWWPRFSSLAPRALRPSFKIVRDLTERKKAEIALADAHQHLERRVADRTAALKSSLDGMEELLYTIAHDLRAPNRAITGYAQVLESDYRDRLDETARDYISRITSAARQNDALVRDVLEFGWLVHVQFPEGPVDARRSLDAALGELDREVLKRDPKIQVEGNWVPMVGSDALLKQIFSSLLAAAVSHVPPEQRPELRISAQHRNGYLRIELHDNGPGISPDLHAQIFQPFLRLNPKVGPAGTSMAFAIVRKAVERMRGRVGLDSTPGEGNCFWLEFRSAGASALAQ